MSKKDIGERRMRINMVLCSNEAAFRVKTYFVFLCSIYIFCIFVHQHDALQVRVKTWQRRVAPMMLRDWRRPRTP